MPNDLSNQFTDKIERFHTAIDKELAKQLEELPDTVNNIIRGCINRILGLNHGSRSGSREVDYWADNGVNQYIKDKAFKAAEEFAGPAVEAELKKVMKLKSLSDSVGRETRNRFERAFAEVFDKRMRQKIEELADKYAKSITKDLDKALEDLKHLGDIRNPDYFKGKVGDIIAQHLGEKITTGDLDIDTI